MVKTTTPRATSLLLSVAAMLIVAAIVPGAVLQEKSSMAGTWKANLEKSKRDPNHLFESVTLRIEVSEDVVLITFKGVNMSGGEESGTSKLHPDGKEHPIPEAPGFVEVSRWVGPRLLETVGKKDGKVAGRSTYEISSDGKTLTAKSTGIDASGSTFEQVIVFDRQ